MKVALVHDYIKEYGGAERVLEALHEMFPDAPVYTSVYIPQFLGPHRDRFRDWKIRTSWLQYVPFKHKLISPFRLLSPWIFKQFDLSEFDVVIVSATGAYFPNTIGTKLTAESKEQRVKNPKHSALSSKPIHICYCHTPPRYLYGYATARDWKKHKVFAVLGAIANHFLRMVDFNASRNVDYYIANSQEVAARIKKFYRRDSRVIYPPVEARSKKQEARSKDKKGKYYLTGGRLARAKHVDLIVRACRELNVPLKVFGRGFAGYEEELKEISNTTNVIPTQIIDSEAFAQTRRVGIQKQSEKLKITNQAQIEFLGEVTDEEKFELMRGAKGFLFAAEDEDSGITPVEAMAVGTPVIAYRSGGIVEKITDGKTGVFFDTLSSASLQSAIKRFEKMKLDPKECIRQAEKFSKKVFVKEMEMFVRKVT